MTEREREREEEADGKAVETASVISAQVNMGDKKKKKATAYKLINENRVNFVCYADYREEKEIHSVVKRILDKIKADIDFNRLLDVHQQQANKK